MKYYITRPREELEQADELLDHIFRTTDRIVDPIARKILDSKDIDELHEVYKSTPEIQEELIYLRLCTRRKLQLMNS